MKKFENVTPGTKVIVQAKGFAPSVCYVAKVYKKHLKIGGRMADYKFDLDGNCISSTFFPMLPLRYESEGAAV